MRIESKQPLGYERLLTEDETVEMLGLSDRRNPRGALRWLCRMRRIPYVDIARGVRRFRPADVQAFIDRQWVDAN